MIQRKQTIHLLLAAIVTAILFFIPYAHFASGAGEIYFLGFEGFIEVDQVDTLIYRTYPLSFLIGITVMLSLVDIFFFKRRVLQMRIAVFNMLLLIGLSLLMAYYIEFPGDEVEHVDKSYTVAIVLPIISAIFTFLAFKGIRKDELLVKSYDRIR
jgi:hypothetical protein